MGLTQNLETLEGLEVAEINDAVSIDYWFKRNGVFEEREDGYYYLVKREQLENLKDLCLETLARPTHIRENFPTGDFAVLSQLAKEVELGLEFVTNALCNSDSEIFLYSGC